jgi:hypothetical protein
VPLAADHGATIQYIAKALVAKENVVAEVLTVRCDAVHVISAMEARSTYQPWHDKASGRTFQRRDARIHDAERYASDESRTFGSRHPSALGDMMRV